MDNTFDHQAALEGAPVWCGDDRVDKFLFYWPMGKIWESTKWDIQWRKDGSPIGKHPPLTTKPNV